jgi:tungstate transport system ATP-binding protein
MTMLIPPAQPPAQPATGAPPYAMSLIELEGLRFSYGDAFTLAIDAFTLRTNARVAIVGRNGSGKTTWLRILAGLQAPDACRRLTRAPQVRIGFLRQHPYLFSGTVAQNLAYPLKLRRLSRAEIEARIAAMLEQIDLVPLAHRRCDGLSGGERKRLALGRALIAEPDALFLDEPDAHLDRGSRRVIEELLALPGRTILFTTHDLRFAHRLGEVILHLRDGRLSKGSPENVLTCTVDQTGPAPGTRAVTPAGLSIALGQAAPPGSLKLAIDPASLVLSREPLDSSMLNQFRGRIGAAHDAGSNVWLDVELDVELDGRLAGKHAGKVGGETWTALISRSSYERLGFNIGSAVVVSFKANAVEIL